MGVEEVIKLLLGLNAAAVAADAEVHLGDFKVIIRLKGSTNGSAKKAN